MKVQIIKNGNNLLSDHLKRKLESIKNIALPDQKSEVFGSMALHSYKKYEVFDSDPICKDADIVINLPCNCFNEDDVYLFYRNLENPKFVYDFGSPSMYPAGDSVLSENKLFDHPAKKPRTIKGHLERLRYFFFELSKKKLKYNGCFFILPDVYGPGSSIIKNGNYDTCLNINSFFAAKEYNIKNVVLEGAPYCCNEYLYVKDAVDGIVTVIEHNVSGSPPIVIEGPLNLGYGQNISNKDLAEGIKSIVEFNGKFDWSGPEKQVYVPCSLDASKMRNLYGFEAKTDLLTGLKATIEWSKKNSPYFSLSYKPIVSLSYKPIVEDGYGSFKSGDLWIDGYGNTISGPFEKYEKQQKDANKTNDFEQELKKLFNIDEDIDDQETNKTKHTPDINNLAQELDIKLENIKKQFNDAKTKEELKKLLDIFIGPDSDLTQRLENLNSLNKANKIDKTDAVKDIVKYREMFQKISDLYAARLSAIIEKEIPVFVVTEHKDPKVTSNDNSPPKTKQEKAKTNEPNLETLIAEKYAEKKKYYENHPNVLKLDKYNYDEEYDKALEKAVWDFYDANIVKKILFGGKYKQTYKKEHIEPLIMTNWLTRYSTQNLEGGNYSTAEIQKRNFDNLVFDIFLKAREFKKAKTKNILNHINKIAVSLSNSFIEETAIKKKKNIDVLKDPNNPFRKS